METRMRCRQILRFAAFAGVLAFPQASAALDYPTRPVRIIVGFAAGGVQDIVARLVAQPLSERLGQQFIVENRAGAGGNLAAEMVVRAPPDGYTLLMVGPPNEINATLYDNLNFNFMRDTAAVATIVRAPNVMEVNPAVPAKTVTEFIAYAKTQPGKINMASAGVGTSQHVAGELFKMMTGTNLQHVPYRGNAPALTDLIGGQVQVMFDPVLSSIEHIRSNRLRPLAVTSATRLDVLPGAPTVGDFVPGYEASSTYGIAAPRNTPVEIVDKLNSEINAVLADPSMTARLADMGGAALRGSPADFTRLIADETEKWGKVVKFSGAKPQ
jgi:tripartite-type tricarboxylate transporter receptor subunit TctC